MKKRVLTIILTVSISLVLVFAHKTLAWQKGTISEGETTLTIQSNYIANESTIAVNLKSENNLAENSNILTKKALKDIIKQKYGKDLVKHVYNKNGIIVASDEKNVGTGYKVELITNKVLTVILFGDVDCNGKIDTDDTVAIAKHNVHSLNFNKYQEKAAHLTVKKSAKDPEIDTDDTVRVAFYNVNGLGKGHAGNTIVDTDLYPTSENINTNFSIVDFNKTSEEYKEALKKFTKNIFTENDEGIELKEASTTENKKYNLTGNINYNFNVDENLFPEDELTGYYYATVLKVAGANENTTIKVRNKGKQEKVISYSNFDVTKDGEEGIVLLSSLNNKANKEDKKIEIEIDLDGEGKLYEPYTAIIDYSTLTFINQVSATITANIPNSEREKLQGNDWNYRFEFKHEHAEGEGYTIEKNEDNKYNVTGVITKQEEVTGFGSEDTDYYIVFAIEPSYITDKLSIKIPRGDSFFEVGKNDLVDGKLTAIITVAENEKTTKPIIVKVDLDGENGKRFEEETITINYNSLAFEKSSNFDIKKELPQNGESDDTTVKNKLQNELNFKPESYFDLIGGKDNLTFDRDTYNNQYYRVHGTIPRMTGVKAGFPDDNDGGYYILFTIKMHSTGKDEEQSESISDKVKVTFTSPAEADNATVREIGHESFDTAKEMAVLWKLDENRTDENKTLKVTVDLDGEADDYAPYHVTIDYSELILQQESSADISFNEDDIPEIDETQFKDWGYKFQDEIKLSEDNSHLSDGKKDELKYNAQTGLLSGIVKEQKLTGGFNEKDKDSYFFTYTIKPENVTDEDMKNIKVTIENKQNEGAEQNITYTYNDFNNGVLTILQHVPKTFVKCQGAECCGEDGTCKNAVKCDNALKITIDIDGDNNYNYKPSQVYYIDYCNLDFVDLHTVSFKNTDETDVKLENGDSISPEDIYDGEKISKPADPAKKDELDQHNYNSFYRWNVKEASEIKEFKFQDGKSEETITKDITLNPMWEVDVKQYITDAIKEINNRAKNEFEIENNEEENSLTIEIQNKETKLDEIKDTAIAGAIAHALMSGEIESIHLELNSQSLEIKPQKVKEKLTNKEYTQINVEEEVSKELKDYFETKILSSESGEKTLDTLYNKWKEDNDGLELAVTPEKSVAKIKDKAEQANITYNIKMKEELVVKFDAGTQENPDNEYLKEGDRTKELPNVVISEDEKNYRKFDGWYDEEGNQVTNYEDIKKDTTLKAHYSLNVDKFIEDVVKDLDKDEATDYSEDFSEKFDISKDGNNVTIDLNNANVPLGDLAETSIPGTIAYILQKGEIKDITLTVGSKSAKFEKSEEISTRIDNVQSNTSENEIEKLKEKVIADAKKTFNEALQEQEKGGTEAEATMDQLEFEGESFTLKIGNPKNETVKLVDAEGNVIQSVDDKKTYTFKLDSDFAVVNPDKALGADTIAEALLSPNNYNTIYIDKEEITVTTAVPIDKDVTIQSLDENTTSGINKISEKKQNTVKINGDNQTNIFTVNPGHTVTISNLNLSGKTTSSAISVEQNSSLNAHDLTYDNETYETPIIKVSKTNATATLNNEKGTVASRVIKEKITKYEKRHDSEEYKTGDFKEVDNSYEYYNYYNKEENSKIYTTGFYSNEGGVRLNFQRYNVYNEKIQTPPTSEKNYQKFTDFNYDGHDYKLLGFTTNRWDSVFREERLTELGKNDTTDLPDGVIKGEDLVATKDEHYWASFKVSLESGSKEVSDTESFKEALKDNSITKIRIKKGTTIDLTKENENGILQLNRKGLSITGEAKANVKIIAKKIEVKDETFIQRLNLEFKLESSAETLIEVSDEKGKLTLWDANIKNASENNSVKSAIKYSGTKAPVDVRWVIFYNDGGNKITETYLDIQSALAEGTDIYGNSFPVINSQDNKKKSAITIKSFDESAEEVDDETDVRFSANSYDENKNYAIRLLKDTSGKKADLSINTNRKTVIAVEYDESHKEFNNIKIHLEGRGSIEAKYLDSNNQESNSPSSGTGLTLMSGFVKGNT